MSDNKSYTFASFLTDFICIVLILLLCQACGCNVFRGIGHAVGEAMKAYHEATMEIHNSSK